MLEKIGDSHHLENRRLSVSSIVANAPFARTGAIAYLARTLVRASDTHVTTPALSQLFFTGIGGHVFTPTSANA